MADVCANHSGLEREIAGFREDFKEHKANDDKVHDQLWENVNNLRNRLPTWATALISLMAGIIGWLAKG